MPHVGCNRSCCIEARSSGKHEYPTSIGLIDHETGQLVLIEATPAIDAQIALLHSIASAGERCRRPVDAVVITHAHMGHYLGLAHFGREVASTHELPCFVSKKMAEFLRTNGPWSQLVALDQLQLNPFSPGDKFEPISGVHIEAIQVPHRDEFSDTMAFRIHGPNRTVLFVPDIDRWDAATMTAERLEALFDGVDVAYVDGTFYDGRELPGRDKRLVPHPMIVDSMERFAERAKSHPGSIRFIHMNHTNPAFHDADVRRVIEEAGFAVAKQGERLGL